MPWLVRSAKAAAADFGKQGPRFWGLCSFITYERLVPHGKEKQQGLPL